MKVSIVVPVRDEEHSIRELLDSLLAQTRPPDEILVVNNASTDETGEVARAVPGIRVIEEPAKAVAAALRSNVDVALTLYRNGSWAA